MKFIVKVTPIEYRGHTYHNFDLVEDTQSNTPLTFRFEFKFVKAYSNEYYLLLNYIEKFSNKVDLVCKEQQDQVGKVYQNLFIRFGQIEYRIRYSFFNTKFDFKLLCKLKETNSYFVRKYSDLRTEYQANLFEFADNPQDTKADEQLVNEVAAEVEKKKKDKKVNK